MARQLTWSDIVKQWTDCGKLLVKEKKNKHFYIKVSYFFTPSSQTANLTIPPYGYIILAAWT